MGIKITKKQAKINRGIRKIKFNKMIDKLCREILFDLEDKELIIE